MATTVWPRNAQEQDNKARDEARRTLFMRARGFSVSHDGRPLVHAAYSALQSDRHDLFVEALNHQRKQLDELEQLWRVALGEAQ